MLPPFFDALNAELDMCGIVGLYLKNPQLESQLGKLFEPMLQAMTDRGPDSAGFAIYGDEVAMAGSS
jgi:glutamate synthase domain-containing protein 1